jgi:hypothetical protein
MVLHQILKFLSVCIILALLFLSLTGALTNSKTALSFTSVVDSPSTVIWQYITDPDKISRWQNDADKIEMVNMQEMKKGTILKVHYKQFIYNEKIVEWFPERKLNRQVIGSNKYPLLTNFITSIELKPLKQGSTEINIAIEYTVMSFFTKIYNQIYLRRHFANQYKENLANLKNLVEKIL